MQAVNSVELKVTDNGGLTGKDPLIITVSETINQPPVANAGGDQTITLPVNSINLDGRGSTDPDNNITAYAWIKLSGPSTFNLVSSTTVQSQVTDLVQGVYKFELNVTDAGGLFSKDTLQIAVNPEPPPSNSICDPVNRPLINAQLTPFGTLSLARSEMVAASAGDKILFAGGKTQAGYSSRVDIYDVTTQRWSTAELSQARYDMAAISVGNKIFFAGGHTGFTGPGYSSRIDIYDVSSNTWSMAELSEPRSGVAAATIGNKVFFAGGGVYNWHYSNKVDIYDIPSNTWSVATLSEQKSGLTATAAGNKIYFAGGWTGYDGPASSFIDIYDNASGTWSISFLSSPKSSQASIFKDGKIYWSGGFEYINIANFDEIKTCRVQVMDVNTQASSFTNLFQPNIYFGAYEKDNKIIYLPGWGSSDASYHEKFDIFDTGTGSWSIGQLHQSIPDAVFISVNNIIYVAGGHDNNYQYYDKVWRLEL